jgi:hypothetical protein
MQFAPLFVVVNNKESVLRVHDDHVDVVTLRL